MQQWLHLKCWKTKSDNKEGHAKERNRLLIYIHQAA